MKDQPAHNFSLKFAFCSFLWLVFFCVCGENLFAQTEPKNFTQEIIVGKNYIKAYDEAEFHFEHQEYLRALNMFKKLAEEDPNNAMFQYKTGICYLYKSEESLKSVEYIEKAKSMNPKLQHLNYFLGRAYSLNYRFDDAIEHYQAYLKENIDPHSKEEVIRLIEQDEEAKELIQHPIVTAIQNIGSPINTSYSEYVPVISSDESVLIFTYRGEKSKGGLMDENLKKDELFGDYYEDIYISYRVGNNWLDPEPIGDNINSLGHDACIALSSDGQKLFIYKSNRKDNGDIFMSELDGETWTKPVNMGETINSKSWDGSVSISGDETQLYFASDRPGGYGGRDIYQSSKKPDGTWGPPRNMGKTINTKYDDDAPFIHPDGKTLYFSSEGHKGIGGYDIFKTILEGETWSKPQNVGTPINTPGDDIYFVVSASGETGYYSSGKPGGLGQQDIYTIDMNQVGDKPVLAMIKGSVFSGGKPVKANIVIENMDKGSQIGPFASNAATGKYLLTLPPGVKYRLTFSVPGFKDRVEYVDVKTLNSYVEVTRDFQFEVNVQLEELDSTETIQHKIEQRLREIAAMKAKQSLEALKTGKNCDETIRLLNADEVKQIEFAKGPAYKDLLTNYSSQKNAGETYKILLGIGKNTTDFKVEDFEKYGKIESNLYTDGYLRFFIGTFSSFKEADDIKNKIMTDLPSHCLALVQVNSRGINEYYAEKMKKQFGITPTEEVAVKTETKEPVKETPKETSKETIAKKEPEKETPKEIAKETPKEVAKETPIENSGETEECDCRKYVGKDLNNTKVYNPFVKSCGKVTQEGLIFKVQIGAYRHPENFKYDNVKDLAETEIKPYEDGITRFTMKEFTTLGEAEQFRQQCISKGVKDAWVVAFYNGKRTMLEELIKMNFFRQKSS